MRLVVTGGGTGGGIYPALAVIDELVGDERWATAMEDVTWVGTRGGMEEEIVGRRGIRFEALSTGPVRGMGLARAAVGLVRAGRGALRGRRLLAELGAEVVLATGGYVAAPMMAAAWRRCPSLIFLPDVEPGLAVRYLAPLATRVAVSFEEVSRHFAPGKAFVSGYPIRREFYTTRREVARGRLGIPAEAPVLLVMGGSTGGRGINDAVRAQLRELLEAAVVVHVSGQAHHDALAAARDGLAADLRGRYHLHAYLYEEMPAAMAAADLAVARAGAATLAEFPAVGLPAILVPYPYSGRHQQANAAFLASQGAAVVLQEDELEARLLGTVVGLLGDERARVAMSRAGRALARPEATTRIAAELAALAEGRAVGVVA